MKNKLIASLLIAVVIFSATPAFSDITYSSKEVVALANYIKELEIDRDKYKEKADMYREQYKQAIDNASQVSELLKTMTEKYDQMVENKDKIIEAEREKFEVITAENKSLKSKLGTSKTFNILLLVSTIVLAVTH